MSRKYPVTKVQLSVDELLALPPLPRSFRFEILKGDVVRRDEDSEEKRMREFEEAKKRLRDLALALSQNTGNHQVEFYAL